MKKQYPRRTHDLNSTVITSLKDHMQSLESKMQFLRDQIKCKNTLSLCLILSKSVENKNCESKNSKIANNKKSCLQKPEKENITPGKISG